jgi:hypothetical protein
MSVCQGPPESQETLSRDRTGCLSRLVVGTWKASMRKGCWVKI